MKIVNVIPLKKAPLRSDLTYFTTKNVEVGNIVTISLRNKDVLGLVVSAEDARSVKADIKDLSFDLKKIIEVKEDALFSRKYLDSVMLASKYFACSKNNAVASLLPAVFLEEYDKLADIVAHNKLPAVKLHSQEEARTIKSEKLILQQNLADRISNYKTLVRESFSSQKSVYIVLPTENDIKDFEAQLARGIEQFTFSIYSSLGTKKTLETAKAIVTTKHPVLVLGTPMFLSLPRGDFGTIILEHESSSSYKTIARPYMDMRVFAEIFARKINAKFILADELLQFETLARESLDSLIPLHPLAFRANFTGKIEIEDRRGIKKKSGREKFAALSEKSIESIQSAISRKKNSAQAKGKVFVLALRKGLATETICRDCGTTVTCDKCSAPMVLYNLVKNDKTKTRIFICNHCGSEKTGEITCQNCQSWNLIPLGIGTDAVGAELEKIFPKHKIFQLDKTNIKNKKDAEKIINEFDKSPGSIMVGSEMALYYLKEKVSLSVIASFDSLWSIPDFRMSEKVVRLVLAISSRTEDKLIIQTKNTENPAIGALESGNLSPFVKEQLEDRRNLSYPPFMRFIKIRHLSSRNEVHEARLTLKEIFKDYNILVFEGFVRKINKKYVTNGLIKLESKNWSLPELSLGSRVDDVLLEKLLALPPSFEVMVDPENLL